MRKKSWLAIRKQTQGVNMCELRGSTLTSPAVGSGLPKQKLIQRFKFLKSTQNS